MIILLRRNCIVTIRFLEYEFEKAVLLIKENKNLII